VKSHRRTPLAARAAFHFSTHSGSRFEGCNAGDGGGAGCRRSVGADLIPAEPSTCRISPRGLEPPIRRRPRDEPPRVPSTQLADSCATHRYNHSPQPQTRHNSVVIAERVGQGTLIRLARSSTCGSLARNKGEPCHRGAMRASTKVAQSRAATMSVNNRRAVLQRAPPPPK